MTNGFLLKENISKPDGGYKTVIIDAMNGRPIKLIIDDETVLEARDHYELYRLFFAYVKIYD